MMNRKMKARWVAALRSGDYKQASSSLRTPDGYCCLGVFCDLHDPSKWDRTVPIAPLETYSYYEYEYDIAGEVMRGYPPPSLRRKYRLTVKAQRALADMNDEGISFDEIADYIENEL
jgi:hypothetical protein